MRVVESFQDSEGGVNLSQGVARASLNPVLSCVIPLGSDLHSRGVGLGGWKPPPRLLC